MLNEWLVLSLGLVGVWLILYLFSPKLRKEMLWVSLFTAPLGLTEPIFVPEYWFPPSLFNLANTTGFDIESIIFAFCIGGIASVLYERLVGREHVKFKEPHPATIHWLAMVAPAIVFFPLYLFSSINPIYSAIVAATVGAIATIFCRVDLAKQIILGGLIFGSLYFSFFIAVTFIYPNFIPTYWNFEAISGILLLGVPLEEVLFAFSIGMLWSGIYEHMGQFGIMVQG